ncbi:MAG: thioredoxin family protein [Kutzneria sp.]|nr:thioredoxin family protein [Kutzneria sp.]
MTGVLVLVGALALATALGFALRSRQGRLTRRVRPTELPAQVRILVDRTASVTLVQLSTTFCAPCRHTRTLLAELASRTDGLSHRELDLTALPEVAAALHVLRTPTTLALTTDGVELLRVGGVPRQGILLDALRSHLPG